MIETSAKRMESARLSGVIIRSGEDYGVNKKIKQTKTQKHDNKKLQNVG